MDDFFTAATATAPVLPAVGAYGDGSEWPWINAGFEFVKPAYELMLKRYETLENRGREFLKLAAAIIVAVPALWSQAGGGRRWSVQSPRDGRSSA